MLVIGSFIWQSCHGSATSWLSVGLIAATTYYQGGGLNGRVALVALSGALFFWVLFVAVLGIPHPPGIWPALF